MVNKVILVGNVGKDPEIRYFENEQSVANFSLATTERGYKTKDGKEVPDRTEWHNLVAWRGLAKVVENYVKKGSQIYVEGRLRTRSYDDANGVKRYVTEVVIESLNLLGRKSSGAEAPSSGSEARPAEVKEQAPVAYQSDNSSYAPPSDTEDDLPF